MTATNKCYNFVGFRCSPPLKSLKATMTPLEEMMVKGGFAENYSYAVQDEIHSFHGENKQATLHPSVAKLRNEHGTLEHRNVCVVSDCKDHTIYGANLAFLKWSLKT